MKAVIRICRRVDHFSGVHQMTVANIEIKITHDSEILIKCHCANGKLIERVLKDMIQSTLCLKVSISVVIPIFYVVVLSPSNVVKKIAFVHIIEVKRRSKVGIT